MHFHSQNLKTDEPRAWFYKRCWLHFKKLTLHASLMVPGRSIRLMLDLNYYGDTVIGLSLSLWLFSLHLSIDDWHWLDRQLEKITRRRDQKYTNGRQIGFYWYEKSLWIAVWDDPMESRGNDPWWSTMHVIHFDDLILGKSNYTKEVLNTGETEIPMPEGNYPATYAIERCTWKRPRWPFPLIRTSIYFDIPVGLPHDGKGENSWDCGMDGITGTGTAWTGNIYAAVKKVALRALETRAKYGSLYDPAYAKWREDGLKRIAEKEAV